MVEIMLGFFPYKETLCYEGNVLRLCIMASILFWERTLWEKEEEVTVGFSISCIPSFC